MSNSTPSDLPASRHPGDALTTPVTTRCAQHGHINCCVCGPAHAAPKPSRLWRDLAWAAVVIAVVAAPYAAWLTGG